MSKVKIWVPDKSENQLKNEKKKEQEESKNK